MHPWNPSNTDHKEVKLHLQLALNPRQKTYLLELQITTGLSTILATIVDTDTDTLQTFCKNCRQYYYLFAAVMCTHNSIPGHCGGENDILDDPIMRWLMKRPFTCYI